MLAAKPSSGESRARRGMLGSAPAPPLPAAQGTSPGWGWYWGIFDIIEGESGSSENKIKVIV